jgi:CheY-like chemotaxis protein
MEKLDSSAVPALVAALATEDPDLLLKVLTVLGALGGPDTVPHLRYFAEASQFQPALQSRARASVEQILKLQYSDLPAAADALVAQANRYYHHAVDLGVSSKGTVRLWRWIPREGLHADEVSVSYAEEYLGLELCRQALALAPDHQAAQVVMFSLALEKAADRVGVDQLLPEGPGQVSAEALVAGPALLNKVLAKGLDEGRSATALGAIRALAHTGTAELLAVEAGRHPPLVRALGVPDRRLQFAAADAVLSLRPQHSFPGSSQVILILSRALMSNGSAKALVIDHDTARGTALASLAREAGYEAHYASGAREGFTIVAESADYELVFIEPNIRDPSLSTALNTFRADLRTAGVPIAIPGELAQQEDLLKLERRYPRVKYILRPQTLETLKLQLDPWLALEQSKPLTSVERLESARRAAAWLARLARGEIRGIDHRPAEPALLIALQDEALAADAVAAISLLPSRNCQVALADLVLRDSTPAPLRVDAAQGLRQSLRLFGLQVPAEQAAQLVELLDRIDDPSLHQAIAAVVGAMNVRSQAAGDRLRGYVTPGYEAAAPPAAAEGQGAVPQSPPAQPEPEDEP